MGRTNITEPFAKYGTTRGELVSSFLHPESEDETMREHVAAMVEANKSYAGFNLLFLAPSYDHAESEGASPKLTFDAAYVTNFGGGQSLVSRELTDAESRCGGLSNGVDGHGADQWPKVRHGTRLFENVLQAITPETTDMDLVERLFGLLTWVFAFSCRKRLRLVRFPTDAMRCFSKDVEAMCLPVSVRTCGTQFR